MTNDIISTEETALEAAKVVAIELLEAYMAMTAEQRAVHDEACATEMRNTLMDEAFISARDGIEMVYTPTADIAPVDAMLVSVSVTHSEIAGIIAAA